MKKNTVIISLKLLVGLFAISLILMPANAQAKNIKVGIIDCYSGPPAMFGNDALNGFKMALKDINREGVLGNKIVFLTRDTKFKVDLALNMAKELVLREDVDILVGTINSGAALAVSAADRQKGPSLCVFGRRKYSHGRQIRRGGPFHQTLCQILDCRRRL
jgi:branched-chain amino acid transport system substrate-binding protein